jgi:amino acid transporter
MAFTSVLGRGDVFALAFGAIIGWGWVVLSGPMIQQAGTLGSIVAVIAGAVMVGFVGLAYAELASALPRAGGSLVFSYRGLGRGWAWACGWALVLAYVGVSAFEAVAFPMVLTYLLPGFNAQPLYTLASSPVSLPWIAAGVLGSIVVGWLNWRGVTTSSRIQNVATAGLIIIGVALFVGGALLGSAANLQPAIVSTTGVLQIVILTPFLFVGFDIIPQASEEIRVPPRATGHIILLSIALATVWYTLVQFSVGVGLTAEERGVSQLPTADAARALAGTPYAGHLLVLGGLLGIVTTWNAFFLGGTRLLFAMSRGGMLPAAFARLSPRHGTPTWGIVLVTACSALAPFLGRQALVWIANAASFATVVAYAMVALSFWRLRRTAPALPRPYRVPAGRFVAPAAVVVTLLFLLLYLPPSPSALVWPFEWGIIALWTALGLAVMLHARRSTLWQDPARQDAVVLGETWQAAPALHAERAEPVTSSPRVES